MAIAFICSCGKALKAKDAFAGRKVKCPECSNIIRIPRLDGSPGDDEMPAPISVRKTLTPPERAVAGPEPADELGSKDLLPTIAPLARPTIRPASTESIGKTAPGDPIHAWVDRSLTQESAPWLSGDEERFQKGIRAQREGTSVLAISALGLFVLIGLGAAGWFLVWNK